MNPLGYTKYPSTLGTLIWLCNADNIRYAFAWQQPVFPARVPVYAVSFVVGTAFLHSTPATQRMARHMM